MIQENKQVVDTSSDLAKSEATSKQEENRFLVFHPSKITDQSHETALGICFFFLQKSLHEALQNRLLQK